MDKYEYLVVNYTALPRENRFEGKWQEKYLDSMGMEGWQLCAVAEVYFYFKRPIQQKENKNV